MRVHLRFGKKDPDLCKWRNSIDRRLLSFYINCILSAEVQGKVAYIPHATLLSADATPCEVCLYTCSDEVDRYIKSLVPNKINATIKDIIRKHLNTQHWIRNITVDPFAGDAVLIPTLNRAAEPAREHPGQTESLSVRTEVRDESIDRVPTIETEEEQALRMALLAMSEG